MNIAEKDLVRYDEFYIESDRLLRVIQSYLDEFKNITYNGFYTEESVDLDFLTGLFETHYNTTRQIKGDPDNMALGYTQVEYKTRLDIERYCNRSDKKELGKVMERLWGEETRRLCLLSKDDIFENSFILNLFYTRVWYWYRTPKRIPIYEDDLELYCEKLSYYHKKYYNTKHGKADQEFNKREGFAVLSELKKEPSIKFRQSDGEAFKGCNVHFNNFLIGENKDGK